VRSKGVKKDVPESLNNAGWKPENAGVLSCWKNRNVVAHD
jgi:hypothetical protein